MSELAAVRAEVKQWEREFREKKGRDPAIDDIKKQPAIAQKYKLYKKLTKLAAAAPQSAKPPVPASPATPTRPGKRQSSTVLLSTKRVATSTGPLSTFNPFSPRKPKAKDAFPLTLKTPRPLANPFASPSKSARIEQPSFRSALSTAGTSTSTTPPAPTNTVTRARKRLRGEPVSPTPSKEKRRRHASPDATRPLPRLTFLNVPESDDEEDGQDTFGGNATFMDPSPIKATSSGRSFTSLFDESIVPSADIFGLNKKPPTQIPSKHPRDSRSLASKSVSKTNLFSTPSGSQPTLTQFLTGSRRPAPRPKLVSGKREGDALSPSGSTTISPTDEPDLPQVRNKSPLLPPSPPPASSSTSYKHKGKRKADPKNGDGRKKAKKTNQEDSDDEIISDTDFAAIKVIARPRTRNADSDGDILTDFEEGLVYSRHGKERFNPHATVSAPRLEDEPHDSVVDLPDKLRNILALDAAEIKATDRAAEQAFQNLVYGRRVTHYDPKKGEIWDVGEDDLLGDGEHAAGGEDDEWEGEPIPWEMAEL